MPSENAAVENANHGFITHRRDAIRQGTNVIEQRGVDSRERGRQVDLRDDVEI